MLGIISHLPWATRWLDEFVDFIGLGLASINIANVIVDHRIKSGTVSRDLMFHIVSCQDIKKLRAMLMIYENNEDGKGIIQRTKQQLVVEGLTAMVAGYVMFPPLSIRYRSYGSTLIRIRIDLTPWQWRSRTCGTTSCFTRCTTNASSRK